MKNLLTIILLCYMVSGCGLVAERIFGKPRPFNMGATPPGTPIFQKGWEDGCSGGLKGYGDDYYKMRYEFKQDISLLDNPEYYKAWKDGYLYCRWYSYNWVVPWSRFR